MTGIVLAGGENRRMGVDKAFLMIAGRPMIECILRSLKSVFQNIVVVTRAPELYSRYGVTVVRDVCDKRGPLTGIYSGLIGSTDECNFVVACDMPFLNPGLMAYIAGLSEGYDIVVPWLNGFPEPLHAVYRKTLIPIIEKQLASDKHKIRDLFDQVRVRYVSEQEIDRFDPARKSFKNLNTPQEYEEAACAD